MPKMKTVRAVAKRFSVKASGEVKFKHSHTRHILTKKASGRKRHLRAPVHLLPCDRQGLLQSLPYSK